MTDITPLSRLEGLTGLSLHKTQVSELSALHALQDLEWLTLGRTNVSQTELDQIKMALPQCDIVVNNLGR